MEISKRVYSGLSGNEIFCLHQKGFTPGDLVIGNSVVSMGVVGGISSIGKTLMGGEVEEITHLISEGRRHALNRLYDEADKRQAHGVTGVSSEIVHQVLGMEFLSIGSCVHSKETRTEKAFSTSADGQQLYSQLDVGFEPKHFAFGNVAYAIGVGRGVTGFFSSLARGEVPEYTEVFSRTRHLALERIQKDAFENGANSVIGIETMISPFMGVKEMVMIGTASAHPILKTQVSKASQVITSSLSNEEMWNCIHLGYFPMQLVMGVSVYSLGLASGIVASLRSLFKGEQHEFTQMLYEAREQALAKLKREATEMGADQVIGINVHISHLGSGMIEFLAIGTAVRKIDGLTTQSAQLIPQAVIREKDTYIDFTGEFKYQERGQSTRLQGQWGLLVTVLMIAFYVFVFLLRALNK